jgi:photosystem II stability/assembly factor-like uncharacterized protein
VPLFLVAAILVGAFSCQKKPTQPPVVQPGEQWTARSSGGLYDLRDIATDGNIIVAIGDSGRILTSDSGVNWTLRTAPTGAVLSGIVSTLNFGFVAVSSSGGGDTVLLSSDGLGWTTPPTTGITVGLNEVTGFGSTLIAVGCNGSIFTSSSGVNWTLRASDGVCVESVKRAGLTNVQYIAVGQNGTIYTSPEGLLWNPRTSGVTNWFRDLACGCSKIVAVGDGGIIKSSTNGINWVTADSVGTDLNAVTCSGDSFVAVGDGGSIFTSFDAGVTWVQRISSTTKEMTGVVRTGSKYVAVGLDGTILTSP